MPIAEDNTSIEVRIPRKRRIYSDAYKARIIEELDACSVLGEKGAVLRREGLYHSLISRWRRQLARQTKKTRGRPKKSALELENETLKRKLQELQGRIDRAELIIDVQKKLSMLLESTSNQGNSGSSK